MNVMIEREASDETEFRLSIEELLDFAGDETQRADHFRIGDLAREFGVTLRTLRFYEDRGLLSPERRGTTRLYTRRDRMRLRLVLIAKLLGFSLTEAKQIIDLYHQPNGQVTQLQVAMQRLREQQEVLREQQRDIETSLDAMNVAMNFVESRIANRDGASKDGTGSPTDARDIVKK